MYPMYATCSIRHSKLMSPTCVAALKRAQWRLYHVRSARGLDLTGAASVASRNMAYWHSLPQNPHHFGFSFWQRTSAVDVKSWTTKVCQHAVCWRHGPGVVTPFALLLLLHGCQLLVLTYPQQGCQKSLYTTGAQWHHELYSRMRAVLNEALNTLSPNSKNIS